MEPMKGQSPMPDWSKTEIFTVTGVTYNQIDDLRVQLMALRGVISVNGRPVGIEKHEVTVTHHTGANLAESISTFIEKCRKVRLSPEQLNALVYKLHLKSFGYDYAGNLIDALRLFEGEPFTCEIKSVVDKWSVIFRADGIFEPIEAVNREELAYALTKWWLEHQNAQRINATTMAASELTHDN